MKCKTFVLKRCLACLIAFSILVSTCSGCAAKTTTPNAVTSMNETVEIDAEDIISSVSSQIIEEIKEDEDYSLQLLSHDWEDYVGDMETFVYGLIINQLSYKYDVFPAYTVLSNGYSVYGLAYTDYSECYTNEDESECYFMAGFLPYSGELEVPEEDFDAGLILYDLEYSNETTTFVLKYSSAEFSSHCVVYGQYLKYGIDATGRIYYTYEPYESGQCDESLGSLYSYDDGKYLFDVDVGNYSVISGTSLYSQIDYDELEAEINRYLATQNQNFVSVDIETYAYEAQNAVTAYLLSMQEESFLGYDVQELIKAAESLDPMECFEITQDGLTVLDLGKSNADMVATWLIGTACVIVTAVCVVGAMVTIECPILSAGLGAVSGIAIEIFMEVVISGEKPEDIEWSHVALAAVTGAVCGYLGPYIQASFSGAAEFVLDSSLDGVMGAFEQSVTAWLEGGDGIAIVKSMGVGFAMGFGLSAAFKGLGALLSNMATKLRPVINKLDSTLFPKFSEKASALTKGIGEKLYSLKEVVDSSQFHSEYLSHRFAEKQVQRLIEDGSDELAKKSFNTLKAEEILDSNGNSIEKEQLKKLFQDAEDNSVLGYFKMEGETVTIKKQNGMVGIVFDSNYQTVTLKNGIQTDRADNFEEAAKEFVDAWKKDPSLVPDSIAELMELNSMNISSMSSEDTKKLVRLIQRSDWVLHENIDMQTITLVPRSVHDKAEGGIAHMGGFALAKFLKSHMGSEFFDRILSMVGADLVAVY